MYNKGHRGHCVIRCKNDFNILPWLELTWENRTFVIHTCKSEAEPYGLLWMEAIILRKMQPQMNLCTAHLDHLVFITAAWAYRSSSLTAKAFLLCSFAVWICYFWGVGVSVSVFVSLPASQIPPEFLRYTQTGTKVEILWPQRGRPTETGLPLILGMKKEDNALYMFPFLELLIIVRSASWPKNRFLMRCCFPVPSPSTRCFWVHCQLQVWRQKPQF